jgi:hypothetical protein
MSLRALPASILAIAAANDLLLLHDGNKVLLRKMTTVYRRTMMIRLETAMLLKRLQSRKESLLGEYAEAPWKDSHLTTYSGG